ncbi:SDR family oxidoreductase [Liquorilactobacillus satsumensis]|uniref:NAD(P)-binding oxidoreductase n=1 Tax=Liquorilactobacillus satsumensis TaxID=259059 RepID=UPI0021C374A9|nr:NAD(P)-binding oxidoreductase [Liquorilactobacillus satsumensis]MCP9312492.1 SDR family oxidoreductase [Liquorilactobacillus satsumensis]MCP9359782.1 SDR family oxidoreductase [Liquorilactobacillus satsumensis]
MTSVFLVGAHGKVGRLLVPKLINQGLTVSAGLRDLAQASVLPDSPLVIPQHFDLTALPETIAHQFKQSGADTIIFSAGSGGNTGDDQTLIVDLDGAIKTMEAAQVAGITRYIMVSSAASNQRELWDKTGIKPYMIAKYYADKALIQTDLDYTIVRPGPLTDSQGTGNIKLVSKNAALSDLSIPRDDVAAVIAAIINNRNTFRKSYTLGGGTISIKDAFKI